MTTSAGRSSPARARLLKQLFILTLAGLVTITILSYLLHWSWTGFSGNGTVWDWLNLFLLPFAVGLVPLVFESSTKTVAAVLAALCVPLTVLLVGGYGFDWSWTGFEGNTLWDWLHLLLVPVAIPIAVRGASSARASRTGMSPASAAAEGSASSTVAMGTASAAQHLAASATHRARRVLVRPQPNPPVRPRGADSRRSSRAQPSRVARLSTASRQSS